MTFPPASQTQHIGDSLVAQWLGLCTFNEGGTGSVHGQELSSHKPLGAAGGRRGQF